MKPKLLKGILIAVHALAVIIFLTGVTAVYCNPNFAGGIRSMNSEVYEDSEAFYRNFNQDIRYAFNYLNTRRTFETDGRFDLTKSVFSLSTGEDDQREYSVEEVINLAKRRGYYLDDKYQVLTLPDVVISGQEDNERYMVNWKNYIYEGSTFSPADPYMTINELICEVLDNLGRYYAAYDALVLHPTNFRYRFEYGGEVDTNSRSLSIKNAKQLGRYAITGSDTMIRETNLSRVPAELDYLASNSAEEDEIYSVIVAVDTTYPEEDIYSREHDDYLKQREYYSLELVAISIGLVFALISLILLIVVTVSHRDWAVSRTPVESRVLACALAIIVLLFLTEKVFSRVIHIYLPQRFWANSEKSLGYFCIYTCVAITAFSIFRSYLDGSVWQTSLTRNFYDRIDRYLDEHSFSARMGWLFAGYVAVSALLLIMGILFLVYQRTLVQRFIGIGLLVLFGIFNVYVFLILYKKTAQMDKIKEAVGQISTGDTTRQLKLSEFDGKELSIARSLNNIGTGLDRAITEQVKSERLRTDLITNVSHDIKTPLTSIINYIDLIKRENPQDPKIREYLQVLEQKSQHLKSLTEDLVEASKVSSGNVSIELSEIDFSEIVQQANGEFEEKFATRGLSIVSHLPGEPVMIRADGASLWRVLENVYNNAFKYAAADSRVYTDLFIEEEKAVFTIKNMSANPLNIRADELTERFVRGDVSRSTEGSGLGLSIAGSLTKLQNAEFEIQIDGDLFKAIVRFPLLTQEDQKDSHTG